LKLLKEKKFKNGKRETPKDTREQALPIVAKAVQSVSQSVSQLID
jgi:hypothetical protein